ncbi:hypothetical protein SH661x_004439 [Planctomicrobium sp. SH661]|uniref:hypothetical protein n=1 Tax=Planctomicrobium sp. SH661 TaxID=3448124 RepID=UPI003F5BDB18
MPAKTRKARTGSRTDTSAPIPPAPRTIAQMLSVAATLLNVPGFLIYLLVLAFLKIWNVSLAGNVMAPLLLACIGLGLFLLTLTGLAAGLWVRLWHQSRDRLNLLCMCLNGLILMGMIAMVILMPQFE